MNIPERLKNIKNWICWKAEYVDGYPTVTAFSPITGKETSFINADGWGTFKCSQKASAGYDGIGFMVKDHMWQKPYKIEDDLKAEKHVEAAQAMLEFFNSLPKADLENYRDPDTGLLESSVVEAINQLKTDPEIFYHKAFGYLIINDDELEEINQIN